MNKDDIVAFLKEHKEEMERKYGVKKIGLFGSYVRGEVREDSDIDIAVELDDKCIFRNFFALEEYLKKNLKKNIDLGIESAIKPAVRKRVLDEIVYV
jgi:predicted nucleotidyltransferase